MPDNPIKHSDIIQPGNPFNDLIKGLEKTLKLLKETSREYIKFAEKQNISTKEGRKNIQSVATATQQLSIKEKEAIKIKQQLEREQAKLNLMSSQEYKDLIKTREAAKAKNAALRKAAKAMDGGYKSTNRWSKALGSFQFKFNALGNIAANVASKITQTINRALRNAVDIVVRFDQAMADTKAITGATGKEFVNLSKSARDLGRTTKFTASEVAKLQKEYGKLGFTTKEILAAEAATLDMAAATYTELPRAAEVVGTTIRQFGLAASESRRVTDVMARSFSDSALDMERFADAMKMAGPAAHVSGLSLERTTAMLGQLANAGITGTMAGTSLRNIMLGLAKESGTLSEKIAKVSEKGLDLAGATEEVQRRAATALLVLADGVDTVDSFTESLEDAAGAAGDMADIQLDTLAGKAKLVKSAWEGMILAMLTTEDNMSGIKWAMEGIITLLNTMAVRAETGFSYAMSNAIVKASDETMKWGIELDKANKNFDMVVGGFKNFKENWKGFGKDLWNELFPKPSADETKQDFEDITELVKNLKDEFVLDEEEQDAINMLWGPNIGDEENAMKILDKINREREAEIEKLLEKQQQEEEAIKKAKDEAEKAEEEKQKKIQETFDLANTLTSTFTDIFARQKQKELSAVGDNAEKRAEIEKKYAKKEQALAISQAVVDGAAAIVKTFRNMGGFPTALPFVIAQAAATAAQIGVIASQKFEEGGPIFGPSHKRGGVPIEAEGGEYVINKKSTSRYSDLIQAINANDTAAIANAALQNEAFHEVWARKPREIVSTNRHDPYTRKMYELMENTPTVIPENVKELRYPGRTRVYNG